MACTLSGGRPQTAQNTASRVRACACVHVRACVCVCMCVHVCAECCPFLLFRAPPSPKQTNKHVSLSLSLDLSLSRSPPPSLSLLPSCAGGAVCNRGAVKHFKVQVFPSGKYGIGTGLHFITIGEVWRVGCDCRTICCCWKKPGGGVEGGFNTHVCVSVCVSACVCVCVCVFARSHPCLFVG